MHLPGLGPKTARRIWQELGVETLDDLKQAAESEQLRTLTGLGPKTEENVLKALADAAEEDRAKPLLGQALPAVRAVVEVLREHPAADQVSEAGSVRRLQGAGARPRHHRHGERPEGAHRLLHAARLGRRDRRQGQHEGDRRRQRRPALRPARRPARVVRQPAPALHRLEAAQRRAARGSRAPQALDLRVRRSRTPRPARSSRTRPRRRMYKRLGYPWIPPELRENMGELEAAREGRLPQLVELARHPRRPAHALDVVARTARTRSRRWRARRSAWAARTSPSPTTRTTSARAAWRRRAARSTRLQEKLGRFKLLKGVEANIRANGDDRRPRRRARRARLGHGLGPLRASTRT